MRVRNTGKRSIVIDGKPLSVGETMIISDNEDITKFLNYGEVRVENAKIKEWSREELEKKKMNELRKIGDPLGAKDTSKDELIEEIIKKQE